FYGKQGYISYVFTNMGMKNQNSALRFAGLATQWMVMLGLAVWAGLKLDVLVPIGFPLFLITLPLVALTVSLYKLIKELDKKN
ncbi:MAG: hypothetical protein EBS55_08515, partial [Flavobacteriaceae bacterium]|nr:hypothetical protein [Flavobacteriaceae bacterium]